jgi:uncharacterized protein (TIGR02271 family)
MAKTVVGLLGTAAEAESVVRDLSATCGCDRRDIGLMARGAEGERAVDRGSGSEVASGALKGAGTGAALGGVLGLVAGAASLTIPGIGPLIAAGPIAAALAGAGIGAAAGGLIGALTNVGVPEDEAHYYAEGVRRGGTLVTVHARSDATADCAAEVMRKHGAVDIDEHAAHWKREGWTGRLGEGDVLPVAKEELRVGKREVSGGKVRVYTHVVDKPVEERVELREQHADIERRPVDRPVSAGDDAFKERSLEVRETAEEPVVSKRARVTEEVRVGAKESKRQKTVRDTVRDTKVDVQKSSSAYNGPERRKRSIAFSGPDRRVAYR